MLSEEFHNSHEFRKYTLVASSRALQNMRADVLNIEKLSNRFEVGEMRGREHIHHGKYGTTLSLCMYVCSREQPHIAFSSVDLHSYHELWPSNCCLLNFLGLGL